MSTFTELAQQAYRRYHHAGESAAEQSGCAEWDLKQTLETTMPFLHDHQGDLDAMPGLRAAFEQANPQEWQVMWTQYCNLGDLIFRLEKEIKG